MILEECRASLDTAKLSFRLDGNEAAIRNLLDWAENIQQYLEDKENAERPDTSSGG